MAHLLVLPDSNKQNFRYFFHFVVKEVIDHFNKHSYHVQQAVIYKCCLVSVLLSALLDIYIYFFFFEKLEKLYNQTKKNASQIKLSNFLQHNFHKNGFHNFHNFHKNGGIIFIRMVLHRMDPHSWDCLCWQGMVSQAS